MLQQTVYQVGRGYHFFCCIEYPELKKDKWNRIDEKLMNKYGTAKSKHQRYRQKYKGHANFIFLRWQKYVLILHTAGEMEQIKYDDIFHDIRKKPLTFQPGNLAFIIHHGAKGMTVHLNSESYKGVKALLQDALRLHNRELLVNEFDRLNGLPCWSGVVEQKKQLLDYVLKNAGKHGIKIDRKDFRLKTGRKIYKVWELDDNNQE
jgi:hypothetical protein